MIDHASPVAEAGNCHRIAIAVDELDVATRWFDDVLGATLMPVQQQAGGAVDAEHDGGLLTIMWLLNVPIVLLGSTDANGTIGRYLARNGPSVQSLAWEIPDMWRTENLLRADGFTIVGTDIPGRHFFVHPRQTHGLLLEFTDDKLPGDPRHGAPQPSHHAALPVESVVRVTAVVDDLSEVVDCLRYAFAGEEISRSPQGSGDGESAVDVRIGDMTVRLVEPSSDGSFFAWTAPTGTGRYHSLTLALDTFDEIDTHLAQAGIRTVQRNATDVWTDPRDTLGLRLQFVDAASI